MKNNTKNQWFASRNTPRTPADYLRRRTKTETFSLLSQAATYIARRQKLSAAAVFWTKTLRDPVATADWIAFILDHYQDHQAEPPDARILRKPQRNYGVTGRNVRARVDALVCHYQFLASHLDPAFHTALLGTSGVQIAHLPARDTTFDLWVGSSMPFGQKQEGELTVWVTNADGILLARMAFSIDIDDLGSPTLLIGGLQGLSAGGDKKIIVTATRALSGLRPKEAVLVGVQAVARAFGIERVLAVSDTTHVLSAEWKAGGNIGRGYDDFWLERGGTPEPGIGYVIPPRDYLKSAAGARNPRIVDRHRAQLTKAVLAALNL